MANSQQALFLKAKGQPLALETTEIPQAVPGSAVVRVLATSVTPSAKMFFTSADSPVPMIPPLVPSSSGIGRVHAVGADATRLQVGQLVFFDFYARSRDDPDDSILMGYIGGFDPYSAKLMEGEWRNGSYAQYAKLPLEIVFPLNEDLLVKKMGYSLPELTWLGASVVQSGGLMEINIHAGDTVIVAPATGYFGGAGVQVALAMGARVIAAGRSEATLNKMTEVFKSTGRLTTVKLTGDVETDTANLKKATGGNKGADAYMDWSPPAAAQSKHYQACLGALRPFGRAVLMGGIFGNIEIPYYYIMRNSLRIQGRYMWERESALQAIKLLEAGLLKFGAGDCSGQKVQAGFKLGDVQKAMDLAAENGSWGNLIVLEP